MYQIKQFSQLTSVSVRSLRHYDQIGLLKPQRIANGYRCYGQKHLNQIKQILIFKELGFSLKQIQLLMKDSLENQNQAFIQQKELLIKKQDRLKSMVRHIEQLINNNGETNMNFEFNNDDFDQNKQQYLQEAEQRWGHTQAFKQSNQRIKEYTKEQIKKLTESQNLIYQKLFECWHKGTTDPEVQALVEEAHSFIHENWYDCSVKQFQALGQMYSSDPRFRANFESYAEGFADFFTQAIQFYCKTMEDS